MILSHVLGCMLLAGVVWGDEEDTRVYTFGVHSGSPPYEIVSPEGAQEGFGVEVIKKVCTVAGKKCEMVTYRDNSECWSNEDKRAIGLDNRYWDACGSWYLTKERTLVYNHSGEFVDGLESSLFVLEDSPIRTYDPRRHRTGFRTAFWTSPVCLQENNMGTVRPNLIVNYDNLPGIGLALERNEIDVAFGDDRIVAAMTKKFRRLAGPFKCSPGGLSIMIRKDEKDNFAWWKPAVEKVIKSDFYRFMCANCEKLYGSAVNCFE